MGLLVASGFTDDLMPQYTYLLNTTTKVFALVAGVVTIVDA